MTKHLMAILGLADTVLLVDPAGVYPVAFSVALQTGAADNQLVRLTWTDDQQQPCATTLTEAGLDQVEFDPVHSLFKVDDSEGHPVNLRLVSKGKVLTLADGPAYVLIQEGGSSSELYVHAHNTIAEAEYDRVSCADDGSYRTSDIVAVPADLAAHPQFYAVVEQLLRASLNLSYPQET